MKKIRNILIVLGIIVVILISIIVRNKLKEKELETFDEYVTTYQDENSSDENKVVFADYMILKNCLQQYINMLNIDSSRYYGYNGSEYVDNTEESQKQQNIYDLLSRGYIEKNNITVSNVYNFVDEIKVQKMAVPYKIKKLVSNNKNLDIESFYISAIILETANTYKYDYAYAIINIDISKNIFSVEPLEKEIDVENFDSKNLETSIEENDNNYYYTNQEITNQNIASEYFLNYKYILLSDMKLAYNSLNEEYKQKRFPTIESFKEYIDKNKEIFEKIRIEKYEVQRLEDYNQYICADQFGNIYIFNENEVMNYNAILDLYTIDLPQFIEKYDSANVQEKVLLNIEKIKQALNSGDYKYIYSKLADSFKNNKYKTEQEFEKYIKDAIYNNIDIEYKDFANEGETYIYDIGIKNLENEENSEINMQIIMQLKENRDFVMSFSIK